MAGAAEGEVLGGPDGAGSASGQVRGGERGPGRAARLPAAGAGRLRAVAAGQVLGGGPDSWAGRGRCVRAAGGPPGGALSRRLPLTDPEPRP